MCILCAIQKWSRRVATMLPWLVIPLIGLWALSQLLPPAFRFEITSPRLACVFVLLITLFWYEILMPQLSAWRVRRNAQLRERKRFEAIELQKLRKTATRRCRNCLTPYRDQNPGGGRFMCSYCGHISKRPVLDLPVPPGMGMSSHGILKDLVGKGGKIFNGKMWSDNSWMCGQDWSENGNWVGSSFSGNSNYWQKNGSSLFGGNGDCLSEKSYSGVVVFVCRLLTSFFLSIRWLWRKLFRISSGEDMLSDADDRGMASKKGENCANDHESRVEKARRKAEEKRQARLEKELLEEEERKQREEVARLVEERRRLRDEKEAEKNRGRISSPAKEKNTRKDADKRRQERRKDRDVGSSKSNSDAEEAEKRAVKETEKKRDFDKKSETDRRENQKLGNAGNPKSQATETGHVIKTNAINSSRGSTGTRYFDRMKGSLLSSSRALSGSSFFGRGASTPATTVKENKSNSRVDYVHNSSYRKGISQPDHGAVKSSMNGDEKSVSRPVFVEPQPTPAPKKSWQQLFTRSSSVAPAPKANIISRPTSKFPAGVQSPPLSCQALPSQSFDNPIDFGLPSPFPISDFPNVSSSNSLAFSAAMEPIFPRAGEGLHEYIPEEPELFEDPCYVPDPISLLGPVSESLDNFQSDSGKGFTSDMLLERHRVLKNVSGIAEVNKPSPIESPLSRLRVAEDKNKNKNSNQLPHTPNVRDIQTSVGDVNANERGTWQMWSSLPFGQDGLGLGGGTQSWLRSSDVSRPSKEDFVHPLSQRATTSLLSKDDQVLSGTCSPQTGILSNGQNSGIFRPLNSSDDHGLWVDKAFFPPLSGSENHPPMKPQEDPTHNEMIYRSPIQSSSSPFELSPANCWSKKDWASLGSGEGLGKSSIARPVGALYSTPDVQSLW